MTDTKAIAHASFRLIETGDTDVARQIIAPDLSQVRERFAQPPAGCEKPCGTVLLAFGIFGIVFGFGVDELQETLAEATP